MNEVMSEWKERLRELDRGLFSSREISRNAIYRVIILSASIVGFSVSLFSIPSLRSKLEISTLIYSWYLFLGTIILGFFILLFEGRVKYGKAWKAFQVQRFPEDPKVSDYSLKEKAFSIFITIVTLVYPANLLFNRIYENEAEKRFKERVNSLVVMKLAAIEHGVIFLENIFFVLFVSGLVSLVLTFTER